MNFGKNILIGFGVFVLVACGGDSMSGVDQSFISDRFDLPTSTNPTVLNIDKTNTCPHFEFDNTNSISFQLLFSAGNPTAAQSTFKYMDDEFSQDGSLRVLTDTNSTGSTFTLKYDPEVKTYSLSVDYNCHDANDTANCTNTLYTCTGPKI